MPDYLPRKPAVGLSGPMRSIGAPWENRMRHHNVEPNLEEALSEDLVQAMMQADHVDPVWLRALLENVARQQGLDRATFSGRSCGGVQDGPPGPWSPWRRRCRLREADRWGCEKTRK